VHGPDDRLIRRYPDIMIEQMAPETVIATYRRYAKEVAELGRSRYPELARLLGMPVPPLEGT